MTISIIIPIYNVENYIVECLNSVVAQNCQSELECILVDDCGSDKSIEIAREYIAKYDGPIAFSIIAHEKNRGLSAARNTGTLAAKGDFVIYLDSDDQLTPNAIRLMENAAKTDDVEMVQGTTRTIPIDDDFYSIKQYAKNPTLCGNSNICKEFYKRTNGLPVNAWNKMVKKDFIVRNNLFFREGIIHEDQLWMFMMVKKLNKIAFVFEETYLHYRNPDSIMNISGVEKSNLHWGMILTEIVPLIADPHSDMQLMKYLLQYITRYSNTETYNNLYSQFLELLKKRGHNFGTMLHKMHRRHNNGLMRIIYRRYCKYMMKRLD
ncbi:MAG: glycosyltransferase [Bacteroidales bacterium]|nr:glycosyltransferase [Bacteroidales bacterium]